ncbi:MAG: hypothetical protein KDA24_02445 [Deltaproteobacteria bacterium]|nr:hypothetical protein [Deltaproteobacteria bacterium]
MNMPVGHHASLPKETAPPESKDQGLMPCARCGTTGVVRLYSEFGAARRTPYVTHPCPACRGSGKALAKSTTEASDGSFVYGLAILAIALFAILW